MKELYIHIGLPKTATTSLQIDVFPKLENSNIKYLGINHPRNSENGEIFNQFMKSINSGCEIELTQSMLRENLAKGKSLLISDEMIIVSTSKIDWKEKICNLKKIIGSFEYVIILTVREPVKAMLSYLVEYYHLEFRNSKKSFEDIVFSEERFEIFHYRKLLQFILNQFDKDRIRVEQFENIIKKDLTGIERIFDTTIDKLKMGRHNTREGNSHIIIKEVNLDFSNYIISLIYNTWLYVFLKRIRFQVLYQHLSPFLNNLRISRQYKIKIPNDEELKRIRMELIEETKFLNDNFNIDYIPKI